MTGTEVCRQRKKTKEGNAHNEETYPLIWALGVVATNHLLKGKSVIESTAQFVAKSKDHRHDLMSKYDLTLNEVEMHLHLHSSACGRSNTMSDLLRRLPQRCHLPLRRRHRGLLLLVFEL
jgi:hypothetical protein